MQALCRHALPAVKDAASLSLQRKMFLQEDPSCYSISGARERETKRIKHKAPITRGGGV